MNQRILIFIVSYNADSTIAAVLARIPATLFTDPQLHVEVLIIDDGSTDQTLTESHAFRRNHPAVPFTILSNPQNMGYGANQKLGYQYAINHQFDIVCLLHGDGQYAPEELPDLLQPLLAGTCEAVFGSRMLVPGAALRGGMPRYKYYGNKVLTGIQNWIMGTTLSEYHSGYRLYAVSALQHVPFAYNASGFEFDTDIIIQFHQAGYRIRELPIPTFYGDEICHVSGISYAWKIICACLSYRVQRLGLLYNRKFDPGTDPSPYQPKFDFLSSHSLALQAVRPEERILILGCGSDALVAPFANKGCRLSLVDQTTSLELSALSEHCICADPKDWSVASLPEPVFAERREL